tara:strand:+ start:1570 stop:1734 length:165 start_codon:yes stop_codon:yes gene_type:complete
MKLLKLLPALSLVAETLSLGAYADSYPPNCWTQVGKGCYSSHIVGPPIKIGITS